MSLKDLKLLIPDDLEQELLACTNLPTLPAIALKIIDASKNPDISLHEVSSILSSDPALSAKLLKIANSSAYSQRRSLNNLREALTLLGFNASLSIGLSFSLLQSLSVGKKYECYWKRSILSASIARMLGLKLRVARLEDLFLASLLQDIGMLVLHCVKGFDYSESMSHSEHIKFEKETLGIEHSLVGAWLLKSWGLPDYLVNAVLYSHSLNTPQQHEREDENYFHYCVNLSGSLADVWLKDNPGELLVSILNVTKEFLNMGNEGLNELVVEIDSFLPEISSMFEILLVEDKKREEVATEAKELLLERSLDTILKSESDKQHIDSITNRIEKIEQESQLDHLTGVYNRQHIDHLLEMEFEESNLNHWPLSLAFIDIDNFKLINDTYGHLGGDEVLKVIATFFLDNVRQTDIVARYGGDEFLLLLPGTTSVITGFLIERLLESFKESVKLKIKGIDLTASVSIGIATHHEKNHFNDVNDLLSAADKALYSAKAEGKNCFYVY